MFCVCICEKQLLKVFMDLLKSWPFIFSVDYSQENFTWWTVTSQRPPLLFTDKIGCVWWPAQLHKLECVLAQAGGPLRILRLCSSPTTNMAEYTPRWSQTKLLCNSQNPREEGQIPEVHAREYNYPFLSSLKHPWHACIMWLLSACIHTNKPSWVSASYAYL